jgi:hypothetical protein
VAIPDDSSTRGGVSDATPKTGKGKGKGGGITVKKPDPKPTPEKGPPSTPAALKLMMEKYPNFAKRIALIKSAASLYKVDPVELYGVLVALGSRGDPAYVDKSGGTGLARISWKLIEKYQNPAQYASFVRKWGNQAFGRAAEPDFAINYLAWMMGGSRANYPSLDAWLGTGQEGASNKGARYGRSPYQIVKPEGATPTAIISASTPDYQPKVPKTIPDTVDTSVDTSTEKEKLTDPFVAGVSGAKPGGELVLTGDRNKAMEWMGVPVTRSLFVQLMAGKAKYFEDYTGKGPTRLQIGNVIRNNWSERDLIGLLAKGPNFKRSPIYQRDSLAYKDAGKDLVPKGEKIPDDLMRKAIVNGWTMGSFQEALREKGYYEKSNEFQNNYGVLQSSYQNIMGKPDHNGEAVIKRATRLGWTQPTFEGWLRKTPAYQYSPEYQAKAVGFLDAMGMFIGARAQLSEMSLKQMANVPTSVNEGGKAMTVSPPLDLMPSGQNPMLKATFPYTKTPTPPTKAGSVKEPYEAPPLVKKKKTVVKTKTKPKAQPQKGYKGHIGP